MGVLFRMTNCYVAGEWVGDDMLSLMVYWFVLVCG